MPQELLLFGCDAERLIDIAEVVVGQFDLADQLGPVLLVERITDAGLLGSNPAAVRQLAEPGELLAERNDCGLRTDPSLRGPGVLRDSQAWIRQGGDLGDAQPRGLSVQQGLAELRIALKRFLNQSGQRRIVIGCIGRCVGPRQADRQREQPQAKAEQHSFLHFLPPVWNILARVPGDDERGLKVGRRTRTAGRRSLGGSSRLS